jgi:hypothetical protein
MNEVQGSSVHCNFCFDAYQPLNFDSYQGIVSLLVGSDDNMIFLAEIIRTWLPGRECIAPSHRTPRALPLKAYLSNLQ